MRRAYGGRILSRERPADGGAHLDRAGCHQYGDRPCDLLCGLDCGLPRHRGTRDAYARPRRDAGNRALSVQPLRPDHGNSHEASLGCQPRRRTAVRHAQGFQHNAEWPARPGARRGADGRSGRGRRGGDPPPGRAHRDGPAARGSTCDRGGGRPAARGRAPRHRRRWRRDLSRGVTGADAAGGAGWRPRGHDLERQGRNLRGSRAQCLVGGADRHHLRQPDRGHRGCCSVGGVPLHRLVRIELAEGSVLLYPARQADPYRHRPIRDRQELPDRRGRGGRRQERARGYARRHLGGAIEPRARSPQVLLRRGAAAEAGMGGAG